MRFTRFPRIEQPTPDFLNSRGPRPGKGLQNGHRGQKVCTTGAMF